MSYGIQIDGSDSGGSYTVADTSANGVNYAVVASGTSTGTITTANSDTALGKGQEYLMIKPSSSGHLAAYQYTRNSNLNSANKRFGRNIITENAQGQVTNYSIQDRSFDWVYIKDMTYATPTAADYGIQLMSPNGEIFYDTRNAVANTSFNLTNFSEVGSVAGYYGTIYSGTDYLSKYVDSRPLFGFFRQMSGAAESIFIYTAYLWQNNSIKFVHRRSLYSQEGGVNSTNYFTNMHSIWVGEPR